MLTLRTRLQVIPSEGPETPRKPDPRRSSPPPVEPEPVPGESGDEENPDGPE